MTCKACRIPQTDLTVSRIGYGCANLVEWNRNPLTAQEITQTAKSIHAACEAGITLFDHADLYGFGKAEEAFGRVLKQSPGLRERLVIQSKCGQVTPEGWNGGPVHIDVTGAHIVAAAEGSLRRLGTDRLDILLLHVADALVQPEEVARAFDTLHSSGKVRYCGVSNHNATQIQLLKKSMQQPLVVNQIRIGLSYPYALTDGMEFALALANGTGELNANSPIYGSGLVDYCRLNDIQVQAYSPLRGGFLRPLEQVDPALRPVAQRLRTLAAQKDVAPSVLALAWLLRHPAGILPLIGSPEPQRIAESCTAPDVTLSSEEWYGLLAVGAVSHGPIRP